MRRREFIDLILDSISDKFDIYHNYWFDNTKFVIYAYSYNQNNRFASSTEASKLWEANSYEHLFFINCDNLDIDKYITRSYIGYALINEEVSGSNNYYKIIS